MGDMADFANEERMDEVEFFMDNQDNLFELFDAGFLDELGFIPYVKSSDLVPPGDGGK